MKEQHVSSIISENKKSASDWKKTTWESTQTIDVPRQQPPGVTYDHVINDLLWMVTLFCAPGVFGL